MAMTERVGREAFVRQQHAIMGRRDHSATLVAIRVPTLVLCGRQDALTPLVDHQAMAAGISDSRLVVVEDCGHLATIERPAPVNAALRRWLLAESRSEEHTSELQSLMRISYAVFCLKK